MMEMKSETVSVQTNAQDIIAFLSDANNLFHILPQDKISDWQADEAKCSFKVQGGITISLIQDGHNGSNELYLKSGEKSPFPFKLIVHLNQIQDGITEGYIEFNGEVNLFLKMMVEKPLSALFNYMSVQLKKHYETK